MFVYTQANYVASRMVIVGAGPIEHEELVQMVDKAFSRFVYTIIVYDTLSFMLAIETISSDILSDENVHTSPISICSPKEYTLVA